jgi:hypothetical protein
MFYIAKWGLNLRSAIQVWIPNLFRKFNGRHFCSELILLLDCDLWTSNVVFKSTFFSLISNQSLSLHLKIVIQLQKNSKSVDMLKYKFHFKHLEYRPELHFSDLTLIWQYKTWANFDINTFNWTSNSNLIAV